MKKIISIIIVTLLALSSIYIAGKVSNVDRRQESDSNALSEINQRDIAKKLIRFHILANSDSNEDQALKLKIRDKVLDYIAPKMSLCKNIDESREVLRNNDKKIQEIAQKVIKENGYNYGIKTELSKVQFPVKAYGAIVLPQGEYEAYRILIGSAQGHNWWCVMFPPLCFTDITKGNVEIEKTQEEMKSVLTPEEYKVVNNSKQDSKVTKTPKNNKIIVKFKLVEEVEKLINKVESRFE